jgi:hypothetical protein
MFVSHPASTIALLEPQAQGVPTRLGPKAAVGYAVQDGTAPPCSEQLKSTNIIMIGD